MPLKGQKRTDVIGPLKEFFEQHPGKHITLTRLVTASGFEETQILAALNNARKQGYPLDVITRGRVWCYEPEINDESEPLDEMDDAQESAMRTLYDGVTDDEKGFYMIQTAEDGSPILQRDHDGTIWRAIRV